MSGYRILCTGSRTWCDYPRVCFEVGMAIGEAPVEREEVVLVHGACPDGLDKMIDQIGRFYGMEMERHPADWKRLGKAAGFARNQEMVDRGADICLAFVDRCFRCAGALHGSHGAFDCKTKARSAGIYTRMFRGGW